MKITVDKEFTHAAKVAAVKNTLNAMKKIYTENDILTMFNDATGNDVNGEILRCNISGYDDLTNVGAVVEMIIFNFYEFATVRFYIDIDSEGTIENFSTGPLLVTVEKFRRVN